MNIIRDDGIQISIDTNRLVAAFREALSWDDIHTTGFTGDPTNEDARNDFRWDIMDYVMDAAGQAFTDVYGGIGDEFE